MNLNFFITVVFYTIFLLIIHLKLKERENKSYQSNILEKYTDNNKVETQGLPYEEEDTIIPLKEINRVDTQTNQDLLKYLNLEKAESANKSNNTRLENNNLDKYFPSKSEKYTFKEVPTQLANLENFDNLDQSEPGDGGDKVYAFEDFDTQYATI